MTDSKQELKIAVQAALAGDWQTAHLIAQDHSDASANWLHAVLHKIEGDAANSHYWYARTSINSGNDGASVRKYTDFNDVREELTAILNSLNA